MGRIGMFNYTLIFPLYQNGVLLKYREEPPYGFNGLGGLIRRNETPYENAMWHFYEETGLSIEHVYFAGVVSWPIRWGDSERGGAYVYVGTVPDDEWRLGGSWHTRAPGGVIELLPFQRIQIMDPYAFVYDFFTFFPQIMEDDRPHEYQVKMKSVLEVAPLASPEMVEPDLANANKQPRSIHLKRKYCADKVPLSEEIIKIATEGLAQEMKPKPALIFSEMAVDANNED